MAALLHQYSDPLTHANKHPRTLSHSLVYKLQSDELTYLGKIDLLEHNELIHLILKEK